MLPHWLISALATAGVLLGCGEAAAPKQAQPYGVLDRSWRATDELPLVFDNDPFAIDRTSRLNRRLGDFDRQTYYLAKTLRPGAWAFTQYNHRYKVTATLTFPLHNRDAIAPVNSVLTPSGPGENNLLSAVLVPDGYTVRATRARVLGSYRARNLAVFIVSKSVRFILRAHGRPTIVRDVDFDKAELRRPRGLRRPRPR